MAQGTMEDDWQFVWSNTLQGQVWFHAATGDRRWPDGRWERRWSNTYQRFIWFDGSQRMFECPLAAAQPGAQPPGPQQPSTPVEAYAAAAAAALAEQTAREEANLQAAEAAAEEARKEQARRVLQRQREEQERKASLVTEMHENMQKRAQEAARKAEVEAAERRSREEAARQARRAAEDLARVQAQQAADKRYQEAAERRAAERKAAEQKAEEDRRREEMQSQVPPRRGRTSPQANGAKQAPGSEATAATAAPRRESSGRSVSAGAGAKRRAESPSSSDSDSSSSSVRKAAPRPPKRPKAQAVEGWPTPEEFQGLAREDRERTFWRFVHEAVLGPKSAEPLCREHVLGGASCLLPDAQCVAREILAQDRFSLREKIWRCFIATWLGCGGPAFRSYRYLSSNARLFGELCPPAAQLPPADAALKSFDLEPMYENLREIVRLPGHKPKDVLSGDGRFTMGRFGDKQGLMLLSAWRDAFCNLADPYSTDEELRRGLEAMTPSGIDGYLRPLMGWSDLAIKELFTYMEVILPRAFDSDVFVPFGGGATAGGRLVLGDVARGEIHVHTRDLVQRLPPETGAAIGKAFRDRVQHLPAEVRGLPGYASRLEGSRPHPLNVLDVEVCFCWFQAFLKNKVGKWKAFRRDLWEGSS